MADYRQDPRFRITTPLPDDSLFLIGLTGEEAVSRSFEMQLELAAPLGTAIPFEELLGSHLTAECSFYEGKPRYFCGVVESIAFDSSDDALDYYTIDLVPQFALLKNNVQSRIFQNQTVPDILRTVLTGLDVEYHLHSTYPKHNYCVQYGESDYAFACRLMEEEGIYFHFQHLSSGLRMVVADHSPQAPACPQDPNLLFDSTRGGQREGTYSWYWRLQQKLTPGSHTVWDHAFQLTGQNLEAKSVIPSTVEVGARSLKLQLPANANLGVFEYPGAYAQRFDSVGYNGQDQAAELHGVLQDNHRTVHVRMEEKAAAGVRIDAVSNSPYLTAGHTFRLQRHPSADGQYFLTRVRHSFSLPGYRGGISKDQPYANAFECLPTGLKYVPPRRTPAPRIYGMQTATVVGPQGEEIFTDKYGRVQVQFNWHGKGSNSCWVRVGQAWAGGQWGGIFIPRVGQEVLVSFLEGDPDAPVIVGSVYNSHQMPPFELPANRTRMAIKSQSTPSGDGSTFSGIAIEDQKGSEHVQLHSEKDMTHQAEHNHFVNTGSGYYHRAQSTRLRHTGSVPSVGGGGGSGGGGAESASTSTDVYNGPFNWVSGDAKASIGTELSLTLGLEASSITGMNVGANLGASVDFYINPLNLIGEIPGLQSALGPVSGPLGALSSILTGAHSLMIFGTSANVHYGTKFNVQHGSHFDITGWNETTKKPTIAFAGLTAAAIAGLVIEAACLEHYPTALADSISMTCLVGSAFTAGLTYYENLNYSIMSSEAQTNKAKELQNLAEAAANIAAPLVAGLEQRAAEAATAAARSAQQAADEAAAALAHATGASGSAGTASRAAQQAQQAAQTPCNEQVVNGNYRLSVNGGDATVLAVPSNGQGGMLNLMAQGSGPNGGCATLSGDNGVMIMGGSAAVGVCDNAGAGSVKVTSGGNPASTIAIMRGDEGKNLSINATGITIDGQGTEAEAGIVTIKTSSGAISLTLTPNEGVKISAPNISFDATTKISLTAPTVSVSASTSFEVTGAKSSITGSGSVTLTSSETSFSLAPPGITQKGLTLKNQVETSVQTDALTETRSVSGTSTNTVTLQTQQ